MIQYCNQWPAILDFESMFHIVDFQVLKYYFYVSVSFAGSVFSLAKLGRLFVSDDYVELFDGLCSFCALRGCMKGNESSLTKWFEGFVLSF